MPIIKFADAKFTTEEIYNSNLLSANPKLNTRLLNPEAEIDESIRNRFVKFAQNLKIVAPKAKDFIYFSCIMMHAAEGSVINQDTGEPILYNDKPVEVGWDVNEKTGSWKWKSSDPNLKPYKNNNGDIFPESELKKAYRKWIGRPLCKDHQSSSVDGIRGIIVDTYYDDKRKRVIALCALDKVNYPDLARKVATGYANNVSMGTAVGRSICFECGNVAKVEADYCQCVRSRSTYGEINVDLSPIELSLVVTGADPRAQLRNVIASLDKYSDEKQERIEELKKAGCVTPGELERLEKEVIDLRKTVQSVLIRFEKKAGLEEGEHTELRNLLEAKKLTTDPAVIAAIDSRIAALTNKPVEVEPPKVTGGGGFQMESERPTYQIPEDFESRVASATQINVINKKLDAMGHALRDLAEGVQEVKYNKEEQIMSDKLRERAAARRASFIQKSAYFQGGGGVNEPQTYPKDPMAEKVRDKEDKQMVGEGMEPGSDGLAGNDLSLKQKLLRAEMELRKLRREALLSSGEGVVTTTDGKKLVPVTGPNGKTTYKEITSGAADDVEQNDLDTAVEHYLKAYFQGGGGVNEPQTYPKDPMAEKVRDKEDKQMVGEGMEPGSDGLAGDDLSLKQKLLRAKLRAKFIMAFANEDKTVIDKNNSRWEVYAGAEKVLSASGKQAFMDELEKNWENFASKRYGRKLLRAIREDGLEAVAALVTGEGFTKVAQPPMPMPPLPEAAPATPAALEAPVPPPAEGEKEEDGKDPVSQVVESLTEHLESAEKALGDLKDVLEETTGKTEAELPSPAEAEDGCDACDQEADDLEQAAMDEVTSTVTDLYNALDESADELAMLAESLESRVKVGKTASDDVTAELLRLAKEAISEKEGLCKEASLIVGAAKKKDKKDEKKESKKDEKKESKKDEKESKKDEKKESKKESKKDEEDEEKESKKEKKAQELLANMLKARATKRREMVREAEELLAPVVAPAGDDLEGKIEAIVSKILEEKLAPLGGLDSFVQEEGKEPEHTDVALEVSDADIDDMALDDQLAQLLDEAEDYDAESDMGDYEVDADDDKGLETTAEDRRAWRAKVAAEYQLKLDPEKTVETNMPVNKSHALEGLSTKTPEATVEGIVEMHDKIMQQVKSLPKVREAMEHLGGLLKSGKLTVADLDDAKKLEALAVDPAAAQYWKKYWGQGDKTSKQFGNELVKEFTKKKATASLDESKAKIRRAYDIALEMQDKEMIAGDKATLHAQVDEILKFDDQAFESYKLAVSRVAKSKSIKTAAPALIVGVTDDDAEQARPGNFVSQLQNIWK